MKNRKTIITGTQVGALITFVTVGLPTFVTGVWMEYAAAQEKSESTWTWGLALMVVGVTFMSVSAVTAMTANCCRLFGSSASNSPNVQDTLESGKEEKIELLS